MGRFSTSLLGEAKTLLLSTDGSEYSDGAVQEAIFFGQACEAKVIALHVVKTDAESLKAANSMVMQRQQELTPYLDTLRAMAQDSGVSLEIVVVGAMSPAKAIIEQARVHRADVILMGRRGKTGHLSRLVGSMTAKVIGQGFPQVLVVPKDFLITGCQVLLIQDGSPNSRLAAREALSLCRRCTTLRKLTVMAVAKSDSELEEARKMVAAVCAEARATATQADCEQLVQVGNPAELIVEAARRLQADMILLGGRDKKRLTAKFLGHLAEQILGRAHCAVLVVNE